ncbi:MAG: TGS domain-containing protein, partial [Ilumatobacteraceae bacterium]
IHGHWKPVVGRFKDYIAMPKFNLYQSLHTTVIGPDGKSIEVQIRSRDMHQRAEWGVAAHWSYKDGSPSQDIDWLNRIIDWQGEVSDPRQFLESLKTDLDQEELFVFTPKGKVIALPMNSTAVDFAYAVHTEVGHGCIGARVNGRLVPLEHLLSAGDTCEILTSKAENAEPSERWLEFVASPKAKSKIKQWFSRERHEDLIESGRDDLIEQLRREGLPVQKVLGSEAFANEIATMNYAEPEVLFLAIAEGHVDATMMAGRLAKTMRDGTHAEQLSVGSRLEQKGYTENQNVGIHVEGMEDIIVRLSKCCTPVPGDEIIGFLTKERGVSIHRSDCPNAATAVAQQAARIVDVEWSGSLQGAMYVVAVEIVALDRARLLRDVANALSDEHVNIVACTTHTGADRVAKMRFEFEFADPSHLQSVLRTIKRIDSVYDAYRVMSADAKNEPSVGAHPASNLFA